MSYPPPPPDSNGSASTSLSSNEINGRTRHPNALTVNGYGSPAPLNGSVGMTLGGNTGSPGPVAQKGVDLWGALLRRKYIVLLICAIGAALGYLNFVKTPKSYRSSLRLMITTQAPPSIVNGDLKLKSDSLTKHASLITSELVLSQAVESGTLERLPTLQGSGYPVSQLKGMVKVGFGGNGSETISLSCTGPNPHDLPTILNQVVAAYRRNLADDSKAFGEESTDLIKELSEQLSSEKRKAEQRSLELYASLGVSTVSEGGQVLNPYNVSLAKLIAQRDESQSKLRSMEDRLKLLNQSIASKDVDTVKVLAIEAKKYLNLSRADFLDRQKEEEAQLVLAPTLPGVRSLRVIQDAQADLYKQLTQLKFDRTKLLQVLGSGHRRVTAMQREIRFTQSELLTVEKELAVYEKELQGRRKKFATSVKGLDAKDVDVETFRAQEDRQWIRMYSLSLKREIAQLSHSLVALDEEVKTVSQKAEKIASSVNELNILQRQIAEKGEAVRAILDQLNEMNIMTKSYTMTKVKVLDEAVKGHIVAPSLPKSLALGTMLAFAVGWGLAIAIDQSDLLFRSPYEIAELLNLPVIGRVPRINTNRLEIVGGLAPELIVAHRPSSTPSEAFRDLRTSMFFQANADGLKTIQFTSPSPGDGKSTVTANLALSIAQAGKKVVLVDADLRKPRIHQNFGIDIGPGIADVLSGESELPDAIRSVSSQPYLFLLTAGKRPNNPGECVTSPEFGDIIEALGEKFDFVLIDSPPILPVSDPASIAGFVDGVYMVSRIRKGVRVTMTRAKESLDRVNVRWMGVIINGLDQNPHYSEYGYQYGNYSYYGGRYGRYYEATSKQYRDKITSG